MQTWHLNTLLIPSLFANAVKVELIIMISHPEEERVGGFDTPHANEADGEGVMGFGPISRVFIACQS